jgi:hypothetical protein
MDNTMQVTPIKSPPLKGVRVWLSGAIPPEADEAQKAAILSFVGEFATNID